MFGEVLGPLLFKPSHMKNLVSCITVIVPISNMPNSNLEQVLDRFASGITVEDTSSAIRRGNIEYYSDEVEINAKFRLFSKNCSLIFAGHNTITAQLKVKSNREYTELGGDEELPLGDEFQSHIKCFINSNERKVEKKYEWSAKLIEMLHISMIPKRLTEPARIEMDELIIKSLQILRAIIHNEERKLPEDWATRTTEPKIKKTLKLVTYVQNLYDVKGAMKKSLPHLATRNEDVAKEVLGFLCIMLFNANTGVQNSMLQYFLSTKEEVFFMAVRDRMSLSTNTIKEKRSLETQMEAQKKKDTSKSSSKRIQNTFTVSINALKQIQAYEDALKQQRLSGWKAKKHKKAAKVKKKKLKLGRKPDKKNKVVMVQGPRGGTKEDEALMDNAAFEDTEMTEIKVEGPRGDVSQEAYEEEAADDEEEADTAQEYRNDGYIELVLKLMARMCDGQNHHLQDYLREQPDNLKSFNIIGEVTQFLNVIYSNITTKSIDLVIQLFEAMNEFTAGNQDNRLVIYDNKIIDYINFIMRAGDFGECPTDKVLTLRECISNLVVSLVEENGAGKSMVAMEVKDTLDKKAIFCLMTECFEHHGIDKAKLQEMKYIQIEGVPLPSKGKGLSKAGERLFKGLGKKEKDEFADEYMDVGFKLYLILARMVDVDRKLLDHIKTTPLEMKAFNFYKKNCESIEIVKDDELQKCNFRVKSKRVLREEVKELLKWSVDRSSPSNKIRDLMEWSKDIMKDIAYQRRILSNPIAIVLTKGWLVWNHLVTILSFAINIMMLLTWSASASLATPSIFPNDTTDMPPEVMDPVPVITKLSQEQYTLALYTMGGVHNFLCLLVFISYFVGNHPRLPNPANIIVWIRNVCTRGKKEDDIEDEKVKKHRSKMDTKFLSFATFFYTAFLALSVGGTLYHGYFFAFHLLNIVSSNQLLGGVIKAVTQNGRSLLWVGVLGLVVFYLYAIIGFAMMRSMFDPENYLYCDSLWQCTITVIRYGLIGDLFDNIKAHPRESSFYMFGFVVLYHVSFFIFITTIGLNIIFGIIVDTFSELRDLKWTAESDMRDTCFICSRNSYDFEHHGKGFDHHVHFEHNMWSYIFFFIHLNDTKANDYTALEMYVYKLLVKENYDFYPLDRALCLAAMGQDSTETKIDDLLFQVTSIVEKQKREELEKKRREERMRQKAWEQKYRLSSFRKKGKKPGPGRGSDSDAPSPPPPPDDQDPPAYGMSMTQQPLAIESPPPMSPSYQRPPDPSGLIRRRPSGVAVTSRHDRYRRRRSVSPMDGRDMRFQRRMSPSRFDDDQEPLIGAISPRYDDRPPSPTLLGFDNDLLDISPVPISRRASLRSPRMSLVATSPREHTSFFTESDPTAYLRQLSTQYSTDRRASAHFPEGRPLTLPSEPLYPDRERDLDSPDSDDRPPETRC